MTCDGELYPTTLQERQNAYWHTGIRGIGNERKGEAQLLPQQHHRAFPSSNEENLQEEKQMVLRFCGSGPGVFLFRGEAEGWLGVRTMKSRACCKPYGGGASELTLATGSVWLESKPHRVPGFYCLSTSRGCFHFVQSGSQTK